jgi:hypothetical protein
VLTHETTLKTYSASVHDALLASDEGSRIGPRVKRKGDS